MTTSEIKKGTLMHRNGQKLDQLGIITSGSVKMFFQGGELHLKKGDCIGIADIESGVHSFHYISMENTTVFYFPYDKKQDLNTFLKTKKDIPLLLATSMTEMVCELVNQYLLYQFDSENTFEYIRECDSEYKNLCNSLKMSYKQLPDLTELSPLSQEDDIENWIAEFYESVRDMKQEKRNLLFSDSTELTVGYLRNASTTVQHCIALFSDLNEYRNDLAHFFLNENGLDFYDLYTELLYSLMRRQEDTTALSAAIAKITIHMENMPGINKALFDKRVNEHKHKVISIEQSIDTEETATDHPELDVLKDSLGQILKYSDCLPETSDKLRDHIFKYRLLNDRSSMDEDVYRLRKDISSLFYSLYKDVFMVSLMDETPPIAVRMFLLFGYMDEVLAGAEYTRILFHLTETYKSDPSHGFYTMYDWLKTIYSGKREPSKNEFDLDYTGYLHELRTSGKINEETEKRMSADRAQKVIYELQNVFPLVNKITHGKSSTFCPVFSEHNVLKSPETILMTSTQLLENRNTLLSVDYSVFYRETMFHSPHLKDIRENIHVEVFPDIIFTPNIGTNGITWQEIDGKRRTTSARMFLPVLYLEDSYQLFVRLCGEYRWEMCKRIQGSRWNDFHDASLTSEYFEYLQFYRKNHDLSTEAKEKIKNSLQRSKNNYKEVFVRDYMTYVLSESNGAPKLNKLVRKILLTYCPFPQTLQASFQNNPLYKELLERQTILRKQKQTHLQNVIRKITTSGQEIPNEFLSEQEYYEK